MRAQTPLDLEVAFSLDLSLTFDDRILLNSKEVHSVENQKAEMIEERVKVIHHNF